MRALQFLLTTPLPTGCDSGAARGFPSPALKDWHPPNCRTSSVPPPLLWHHISPAPIRLPLCPDALMQPPPHPLCSPQVQQIKQRLLIMQKERSGLEMQVKALQEAASFLGGTGDFAVKPSGMPRRRDGPGTRQPQCLMFKYRGQRGPAGAGEI